jgi:ArsR family transcriptional regulator
MVGTSIEFWLRRKEVQKMGRVGVKYPHPTHFSAYFHERNLNLKDCEIMETHALAQEINRLHANICSALADPSRILLLYLLADGPCNVNSLVDQLEMPQPTVSRHLKVLRDRGLVVAERDGQYVYYRLADKRVIKALDLLRTVLADRLTKQSRLVHKLVESFAG